jgi:hypothetical protein
MQNNIKGRPEMSEMFFFPVIKLHVKDLNIDTNQLSVKQLNSYKFLPCGPEALNQWGLARLHGEAAERIKSL